MKKRAAFLLLFISLSCKTILKAQQNLVLNGNFEDTIACPQNPSWSFSLKHWIQRGGGGGVL